MPASWLRKEYSDVEWTNADLFFLGDTLLRGMPVARVAGFLNRSPAEVRVKALELKVSIADDTSCEEKRPETVSGANCPQALLKRARPSRGNFALV